MSKAEYYVAIDPGDTIGWAIFYIDGDLSRTGQIATWTHFSQWLIDLPQSIGLFIYESYIVRPGVSHGGSKVQAIQQIGAIKHEAKHRGIKWVEQAPSSRKIGLKKAGLQEPSNHALSHWVSAVGHGTFYIFTNRVKERYDSRDQQPVSDQPDA